jgi:RNA polymerase sigma-70 factor (ECF subfamily)
MQVAAVRLAEEPMSSKARPAEAAVPPAVTDAKDAPPAPPVPSDDASLAALVAAAQAGSTAAFERLVAMYQSRIFGFARAYCRDRTEASDLMQEALIKVYRSIGGFRYQSSLLTWMFRIVKNVALDHHKSRRQKERKLEQPLSLTSEREIGVTADPGPETRLLHSEAQRELWSALGRVPEAYRTVLVLADMQGQSYEEIAAIVETPVGTVKSRLFRGRDALREALIAQRRGEPRARRSS